LIHFYKRYSTRTSSWSNKASMSMAGLVPRLLAGFPSCATRLSSVQTCKKLGNKATRSAYVRLSTSTSARKQETDDKYINSAQMLGTYSHSPEQVFTKQGNYEGPGKTTVRFLNEEMEGVNMVDSFSKDGFRLADNTKVLGPCILFPTAVLGWRVAGAHEINEQSLALFTLLDPKLDILVIGHGLTSGERHPVDPRTILKLKAQGLNIEVLTTENAISTYNYLVEEGRLVAAALIPPDHVKLVDTDIVETKDRYRRLMSNPDVNFLTGHHRGGKVDKGKDGTGETTPF